MATAEPAYYCHKCQVHIGHVTNYECPRCRDNFIEEVPPHHPLFRSRTGQPRSARRVHYHGSTPFSNRTIYIGGHPSNNVDNHQPDVGVFFQNVLSQIMSGSSGAGTQSSFAVHNNGGSGPFEATSLEAFLNQFLTQLGENSGPAPAPEHRINAIPTVRITREQARDSVQCAICMDDFNENDEAKRLPCSHHFHEGCILRWLRMHGTCPTCRVTLEGDNTTNHEYHNLYRNEDRSSRWNNTNRRNDRGNNGSNSTLFEFD